MSNIIGFLEDVGRDAALRHASREQLLLAMRHADVSPALLESVGDSITGVRETMYCINQVTTAPLIGGVRETMYCINQVTTAPLIGGVRETMYCINQVVMPPKKAPSKRGSKGTSVRH